MGLAAATGNRWGSNEATRERGGIWPSRRYRQPQVEVTNLLGKERGFWGLAAATSNRRGDYRFQWNARRTCQGQSAVGKSQFPPL